MSKIPVKNLLNSLFTYGRIQTTSTNAKSVRSLAEKLITQAKLQSVNAHRKLHQNLNLAASQKLFSEAKDCYRSRTSGFTRIIKIGDRFSDTAPMVYLELIKDEIKLAPVVPEEKIAKTKKTQKTK